MSESSTKKLIEEIESLPVEERAYVAESVLQTLNPVDPTTEKKKKMDEGCQKKASRNKIWKNKDDSVRRSI